MNDVEISQALADIEGVKVRQAGSTERAFLLIVDSKTKDSVWEPLLNDGQAFRLMVAHFVHVGPDNPEGWEACIGHPDFGDDWYGHGDDPRRAVCLAILAKEGIE